MFGATVARVLLVASRSVWAGIGSITVVISFASAQTYSCGNPASNHCYGTTRWQEQPEYFGAFADVEQVRMGCPSGCGGFLNNEIWLIDTKTGSCTTNDFGMCWVEAGYVVEEGWDQANYFWADSRPGSGNTFNLHILGSTDPVGTVDHFMIIKDGRVEIGTFQVWIFNDSLSTLFQGTSANNAMNADRIDIGQELAGTNGAFAGRASFQRNIWAVRPLGSGQDFVFRFNRQTNPGNITSRDPPFASWAPFGPTPGVFTTRCCRPLSTQPVPGQLCSSTQRCCGSVTPDGRCHGQCIRQTHGTHPAVCP
jgi:hypothetical protein